ncbi:group II intron maturase-specific domain-containing protein [Nocardia sp. CA-107356]|uniref:group II intron maturase-specific domain-containing protein n=1 Tax=Nocardia sp. CA-107356 TaxID=3239972 RepID=UPI003D8BCF1A
MSNDIDTLATALYVTTDDLLKLRSDLAPRRPAVGFAPRLTDAELSTEAKTLRGANAEAMIAKFNPIIAGWTAYYRIGVSNGRSLHWTPTPGDWSTNGPGSPTRTSRCTGSRPATSASSTPPGKTRGCSAAGQPASTCASSPGHRLSGTGWWQGRHLRTTRP